MHFVTSNRAPACPSRSSSLSSARALELPMFCALVAMAATTGPDADFAELPLSLLFIVGFHDIDYHL